MFIPDSWRAQQLDSYMEELNRRIELTTKHQVWEFCREQDLGLRDRITLLKAYEVNGYVEV